MTQSHTRGGKFWRGAEVVILLAGIVGVGIWIAGSVAPIVSEDWGNWVFGREVQGRTTTVREYVSERSDKILDDIAGEWRALRSHGGEAPVAVAPNIPPLPRPNNLSPLKERELIGRLEIPRLELKTIVREGAREDTLSIAAGHVPGTALPGQPGNVGVAGHRDTLFRQLKGIKDGDLIQFETLNGSYVYQVESTQIVKPSQVSVLNPGPYSELTLVTCYPFTFVGSAPDRFIVKARQVLTSTNRPDFSNVPGAPGSPNVAEHNAPSQAVLVVSKVQTAQVKSSEAPRSDESDSAARSGASKVSFSVASDHSRQLAPGISIGVSTVDAENKLVNGWIWVMPDRRTVWIDHQTLHDPLVFYQDGKVRKLILTNVGSSSATGYLLVPSANGD